MQKLNCKVGDLAIVVSAALSDNVGQIVEVIGVHAGKPVSLRGPGHVWQVRVASGSRSLHYRYWDGHIVSYAQGPVPDCRLRPLSGIPDDDEALRDINAPATAEVERADRILG